MKFKDLLSTSNTGSFSAAVSDPTIIKPYLNGSLGIIDSSGRGFLSLNES